MHNFIVTQVYKVFMDIVSLLLRLVISVLSTMYVYVYDCFECPFISRTTNPKIFCPPVIEIYFGA